MMMMMVVVVEGKGMNKSGRSISHNNNWVRMGDDEDVFCFDIPSTQHARLYWWIHPGFG